MKKLSYVLIIFFVLMIGVTPTSTYSEIDPFPIIPSWVKQNTIWWSDKLIDDYSMVVGIQELIKMNVIIHDTEKYEMPSDDKIIPDWFRNNVKWWVEDKINESELLIGMQYLVEENIIDVREREIKTLE